MSRWLSVRLLLLGAISIHVEGAAARGGEEPRERSSLPPVGETPPAASPETPAGESPPAAGEKVGDWQALFRGVEYAAAESSLPRPLRIHVVRIDLREPGIEFLVTPSNGDRPGETDGLKTSTFLVKHGLQLAVNASPYAPVSQEEGAPKDVLGLSVSCGERYSKAEEGYGALLITRDNRARIARWDSDLSGAHSAVGGFRLLLEDGRNVGQTDALHPRTAFGVSEDGRHLLLLAIDGRQKGYSEGTTTAETAEWLRRFGAHQGLNLDGGGSTAMVISDGRGGGFRTLNRPIHGGIPGLERVNANHIGLRARSLPAAHPTPPEPGASASPQAPTPAGGTPVDRRAD